MAMRAGASLALFARRKERLDKVAARCMELGAREVLVTPGDTTIQSDIAATLAQLDEAWGRIDRVFLNAGGAGDPDFLNQDKRHYNECCSAGDADGTLFSRDKAERVMTLNYLGAVNWLGDLIERMNAQQSGTIAITGSMAADGLLPRSGPYTASKAALRALVEGFRWDEKAWGIRFCLIEPGFVQSQLTDGGVDWPFLVSADEAGEIIRKGVENGRGVIRFPWQMSWANRLGAMLPRGIYRQIARVQFAWEHRGRDKQPKNLSI